MVKKCNEMKIGECVINDTFHNKEMFYLFNGTYKGQPVNNTFKNKSVMHFGKHALFFA